MTSIEKDNTQILQVSRLRLTFSIDGRDIPAYFTGVLKNGRPFGEGIFEFDDIHGKWSFYGAIENGSFVNGTMVDYPYTMSFKDPLSYSKYSGSFKNGQPADEGIYTIINGEDTTVYEGHFDEQKRFSGHVKRMPMTFTYNGVDFSGRYTGECKDGQANGNGAFDCDGKLFFHYNGAWDHGGILGSGELHTNNAQMSINDSLVRAEYSGSIDHGCFHGEGTLTISNDNATYTYTGNWQDNQYSGEGTLSVSRADNMGYRYSGLWKNGLYDGQGALIYDNENIIKYIGHFEKGQFRPTLTELVICLCSAENSKIDLPDHVLRYIDEHQTNFFDHIPVPGNREFSYDAYTKEQSDGNSVSFSERIRIIQIMEYDADVFGNPVTEFIGSDGDGRIYYGYYIGRFDGIKSGDTAKVSAYPIGYSSYKSQEGKDIPSIRFLAYQVEKIQ